MLYILSLRKYNDLEGEKETKYYVYVNYIYWADNSLEIVITSFPTLCSRNIEIYGIIQYYMVLYWEVLYSAF